ncbi:MAG: FMN-binding glutamate synthase family protein [Nitrososphaerota archaeon]|nr:FMN-binding glutamate synthase family protein [Nitrososphaerota archaeon]
MPSRSKEFWTRWKIDHIRQLATTGHATAEPVIPGAERSRRVLDNLYLKELDDPVGPPEGVRIAVPLAHGSSVELTSPLYLGDMSFGALSGVPNIAIARAADATGVLAGTGEGGLMTEVAECSRITIQWASARFGVDISTLARGQAVVIKIGQGAKPGIGGHLPGVKVTQPISETRRIPVGRDAISPAPHHDIYSIEDLGQRILALKEATGKPIFVKVGATNYVPYIASGVARMGGAGIIIDGAGAGTGAAPSVVKNNVGIPIELATAAVDSMLKNEGLRDRFTVIAAGRVSTPEDSLKLMALGADMTSLGTATLLAMGCLMVHKCHLGFCPAVLTNKISSNQVRVLSLHQSVGWVVNLVNGWSEEMRLLMGRLGVSDARQMRGDRSLLQYRGGNPETAHILGLESAGHSQAPGQPLETGKHSRSMWSPLRVAALRAMAGTTGKFPAEPEISSMGTTSPPFVEEPSRLSDLLVADGAQVTRPSIDPYREEIEISASLGGTRLRLSCPFFFTHLPADAPKEALAAFARTAVAMGLLFDIGALDDSQLGAYSGRLISGARSTVDSALKAIDLEEYLSLPGSAAVKNLRSNGKIVLLRLPASKAAINRLTEKTIEFDSLDGVILDEDDDRSDLGLEVALSTTDRKLKEMGVRGRLDLLAEGNAVRGSDDVFKLVALGADCVGLGKAALLAVGIEEGDKEVVVDARMPQRLENLVVAMWRDIKLLAGAAGVSCVSSTLTGNHELLRSVDLDPATRKELGVKPAGAP